MGMRLDLVLKMWNFVEHALSSSWSNVRSICYGLFCSMLRIDLRAFRSSTQNKIKNYFFPLLNSLISSKESESKAGGLNILGSFCGLGYDFSSPVQNH
jgi:hypothetical protein